MGWGRWTGNNKPCEIGPEFNDTSWMKLDGWGWVGFQISWWETVVVHAIFETMGVEDAIVFIKTTKTARVEAFRHAVSCLATVAKPTPFHTISQRQNLENPDIDKQIP